MSKYIKVDDLQRYCDNQKDHSITPNEFQRMTQYDFGWHTGTPKEEGWYLMQLRRWGFKVAYLREGEISVDAYMLNVNDTRGGEPIIVAWQKITPYEEKENGR